MTLLELKKINVKFDKVDNFFGKEKKVHVLKDVSLKIEEGEIVTLVGESGCGKTTLGKVITSLIIPSSGELIYKDKDILKCSYREFDKYRQDVQFVQQDSYAALNPTRKIYNSLYVPISKQMKGRKVIEKRMNELMELVELSPPEQFLTKYPHQLSGGQRQRVLLARALSLQPRLLVADEPVSMIDVSLRVAMLNLFTRLNKELGITIIYITHDLSSARYVAQNGKMCVMYLGELVEYGPVMEVLNNPRHPYTQALLSAVPVPDPMIEKKRKSLPLKSMELASLIDRKNGCSFINRCIHSTEKCTLCTQCENTIVNSENNHQVFCSNNEGVPKWKLEK